MFDLIRPRHDRRELWQADKQLDMVQAMINYHIRVYESSRELKSPAACTRDGLFTSKVSKIGFPLQMDTIANGETFSPRLRSETWSLCSIQSD